MASPTLRTSASPSRQRSRIACDYCKAKKLKCDSNERSCRNCMVHNRVCTRNPTAQKPRPTHKRILQLEEENRQLREALSQCSSCSLGTPNQDEARVTFGVSEQRRQQSSEEDIPTPSAGRADMPRHSPHNVAAELPEPDESSYHGPPSALFDGNAYGSHKEQTASDSIIADEPWPKHYLVAQSAKQRQLEAVNFAKGALDFDGVDKSLGMELLTIWWSRQLHLGLLVSRSLFMRDMACQGPYFSKLLLNAIYFSNSKHSSRQEIRQDTNDNSTAGWSFRQRFKELLRNSFDQSSITTIQALLIMSASLFSRCDERSTSWLYSGTAFNMIVDLGLHVRKDPAVSPVTTAALEEQEVHRRLYWAAYSIDKLQCLFQGRPPNLRSPDTVTPNTILDDYEELESFDPISYARRWTFGAIPCHNLSMLEGFCELSIIMERLLIHLYPSHGYIHRPGTLQDHSRSILLRLKTWRESLPLHLNFFSSAFPGVCPLPHNISLLALYNALVILARRPLMSDARVYAISPSEAHDALIECLSAANEITRSLQVYAYFYQTDRAPYILSYATYIAANIYVHVLAQNSGFPEAAGSLRTCLRALEEHKNLYAAAKRAYKIVQILMRRMNVSLADQDNQTPAATVAPRQEMSTQYQEDGCESLNPPISTFHHVSTSHANVQTENETSGWNFQPDSLHFPVDFDFDVALHNFTQEQDFSDNYINMSILQGT